ncbi:MAG: PAP/fibrillin family protein [Chroococcales cyanobacterium]
MINKAQLLQAIAGKNRGLLANDIEKVAVLSAIAKLEDYNPTPNPLAATNLLEGDWRLLYTTSRGLLNIDRFPGVQLGQIYQSIRTATQSVYNIAEIVGVPFLEGLVSVVARFEPVSQRRINVKFERSIISLQRFANYRSPSSLIQQIEAGKKFPPFDISIENREQQGWLDITYLDEDLRIGRGNEGSVYVLTKVK